VELRALSVSVRRNGYGRQIASFESELDVKGVGRCRASSFAHPKSKGRESVEVLATSTTATAGEHPVLVRQGHVWGASFHPELSRRPRARALSQLDL
jgi:5'-phosphate synthase pdxT subunit